MVKALRGNDGDWCCDQGTLRELACGYYKSLFTSSGVDCSNYPIRGFFPLIEEQSLLPLTAPVLDEEVREVIFAMGPLKAPVFDSDSTGTVSVLDRSQRVVDSYNLAIATSSGVWVVMGFFPPPSVVCEVLRQDMQAGGAVVARASQEVLQAMPTSGVG
ncbi:hypothetical protein V6N13_001444 [Hibiscus sabdariffa]